MMVQKTSVLLDIRPGMEVYDLDNNRIGTVKYVKLPEGYIIDVDTMGDDALRNIVAALMTASHIPVETREQLLQSGFIRLDTGLLHADRYIMPDQIREVFDEHIRLRVTRDELL